MFFLVLSLSYTTCDLCRLSTLYWFSLSSVFLCVDDLNGKADLIKKRHQYATNHVNML